MTELTHIKLQSEAVWFITYVVIVTPSVIIGNTLFIIASIIVGLVCTHKIRKWYKNKELIKLQAKNKDNK